MLDLPRAALVGDLTVAFKANDGGGPEPSHLEIGRAHV